MIPRNSQENSRKTQRMFTGEVKRRVSSKEIMKGTMECPRVGRGRVWPRMRAVFQESWDGG